MPHIQFCRASKVLANGYNLIFSRKNPRKEFEIKTKRRCLNFYSIFFRKIEGCTNQFQASSYHTKTLNDKTLDSLIVYLNLDSYGIKRNQSVILFSIAIWFFNVLFKQTIYFKVIFILTQNILYTFWKEFSQTHYITHSEKTGADISHCV